MGRRRKGSECPELEALQGSGHALLSIDGLWCPSCAAATEQVIQRTPGVSEVGVSFATSTALIRWDPTRLQLRDLARRVRRLGYRLGPPMSAEETLSRIDRQVEGLGIRLAVAAFFGMWTMLPSLLLYLDSGDIATSPTGWWIAFAAGIASLPVLAFTGGPILLAGWRTLRTGVPGMDTLVGIGATAALALSLWQLYRGQAHVYFDTAVMLVTLLTLGRFIETRTLRHAAQAIDALQDTLPETADWLQDDGKFQRVDATGVPPGALIQVPAGQRVPLDGCLVEGRTQLDRAVLTGESLPVAAAPGDAIEAGCVNLVSPILVRVEAGVGQRHIDRIGARIAEAAGAKGDTQRLADGVARWVVPVALTLAFLTGLMSALLGLPAQEAVLRAVSVLVVACPCAVGIAVPVAYVTAASQAARQGILFRHPAALETMARIDRILFDKTGTLTEGRLGLLRVERRSDSALDDAALIALAAYAEQGVDHPIAQALQDATGENPSMVSAAPVRRHQRGVSREDSHWGRILVGSRAFLSQQGVACNDADDHEVTSPDIQLRVELAVAGRWLATLVLEDRLREDAPAAIRRLHDQGIECAIVTGDARAPADRIAERLGISKQRVHADCTPEAKALIVKHTRGSVAFAGDGINDGPALAQAAIGLSVADASSTATAAAGVAIAEGGVGRVADARAFARHAYGVMRQNLAFALIYNALGLSLAAFGAIPPVVAVIAMAMSSLTVVANATRLAAQ
ncbi:MULTISPECIES: cation-translocating P-type ATPase [unclassified Halomonas]|uniref:heavy metal translocating P-type ATPase n=1 Tax=unclassified Halomonas TaxID=2609666 RepID=UPI002886046E|nr:MULTISPECIES: cation-translocating P-type ATPase [unclassified Halomonas]MDT0502007.1 cation-translocating P-type ATPase [Halomonas sp. PAR7]MDT0592114.1 cation-translocating P-type ATPase [Halomonas sp. PAR8]